MNVEIIEGDIQASTEETIIVNLFEGVKNPEGATGVIDHALNGAISEIVSNGDFHGKKDEVAVLYPRGQIPAKRVIVVGLGPSDIFDLETARNASAAGIQKANELGSRTVATIVHGAGIANLPPQDAAQAIIEASILAVYQYAADRNEIKKPTTIETLRVIEFDHDKVKIIERGAQLAQAITSGVILARDLVNMPPNIATPTKMAEMAEGIASQYNMNVIIGDRKWAAEREMGAFLAVAKGAGEEPKFIVLEHNREREDLPTIVLVGKGITFDTGGISIKASASMGLMKSDMAGAAAVLGTMKAVGELNLPLKVIGITPCTENMPDAYAYRPSDIIQASNGKTIEIISTDAEGRMVLADGLVFAGRYKPDVVIDIATLTGACVVALGQGIAAGLFCNDEGLQEKLLKAAKKSNEKLWPLPLWPDYRKAIDSDVADMKNSGGRTGGVATSAVFLQEFTDYTWSHIDIAGMALREKSEGYIPSGGTGFGVRLMLELLNNW